MNRKRGFVLPAAVFILVILGMLAAWLMRLTLVSMSADVLEIEGERAYQAAQAGLEVGMYLAGQANPPASCPGVAAGCPGNVEFGNGLARFTSSVIWTSTSTTDGVRPVTFYSITSRACNEPPCPNAAPVSQDYVERVVTATVEQ